jgi:hypothetical protein
VNTISFIGKGLRFRPQRTLLLLLGFAVGVMVMTVLLSVGTAVLDQAMDEDLTGGGDVVLLPVGIDVAVLKTGGVTSMNFDIPNARYLAREFLTPWRLPGVKVVSPEISRVYGTLSHGGHEQLVRMEGAVPSRFRELWPAMTASFSDSYKDRDYIDPDFTALLYQIDAFHPPVVDSSQVWAEWHYFNYHDDAGRSLYVSISGVTFDEDIAASGYSRGVVLFEFVDEHGRQTKMVDILPGREIRASYDSPDLLVGLNAVRLDGGAYRVSVALADSLSRPVTVTLDLTPTPHQYIPPVTPLGEETPFGYVVPVVRGHMTGRVEMNGQSIALDGVGYHDHNWGFFRDAVWDWGIVHAGPYSILYGRFATSQRELQNRPLLLAAFDGAGPERFVLTGDYQVEWTEAPATSPPKTRVLHASPAERWPRVISLSAVRGDDKLALTIEVERHFLSETGGGEQPLFRADETARSFFYQLEGRARLTGKLDGKSVDETGHAYSETFLVDR